MPEKNKLNENALGMAIGGAATLWGVVAVLWHGMLGQPSMMGLMYSGFSYMSTAGIILAIPGFFIGGYATGYAIAKIYNWALKR